MTDKISDHEAFNREDFEGDSSSALGIGHSATRVDGFTWNEDQNAKIRAERAAAGIVDLPPGEAPPAVNREAYEAVEAQAARIRREHPDMPEVEVVKKARESVPKDDEPKPSTPEQDRLGASVPSLMKRRQRTHSGGGGGNKTVFKKKRMKYGSVIVDQEQLMGAKSSGSGGAKSRRKRTPAKKWQCSECHLEFCHHRRVRSKKGRRSKELSVRSIRRTVRMTQATLDTLKEHKIVPADGLALLGVAIREGLQIDPLVEQYHTLGGGT